MAWVLSSLGVIRVHQHHVFSGNEEWISDMTCIPFWALTKDFDVQACSMDFKCMQRKFCSTCRTSKQTQVKIATKGDVHSTYSLVSSSWFLKLELGYPLPLGRFLIDPASCAMHVRHALFLRSHCILSNAAGKLLIHEAVSFPGKYSCTFMPNLLNARALYAA